MDSPKTLIIVDVLIAVLYDPPHMYLCHVCMKLNKARNKYISVQGFPTVPSLFFLPTLAHFIGIFTTERPSVNF
jgi:hypothetical protein